MPGQLTIVMVPDRGVCGVCANATDKARNRFKRMGGQLTPLLFSLCAAAVSMPGLCWHKTRLVAQRGWQMPVVLVLKLIKQEIQRHLSTFFLPLCGQPLLRFVTMSWPMAHWHHR